MYKNHVESLREAGGFKKILQENIGNITAEHNYFGKIATLPRFEQGYPTYIKEHSDTKIKCVQQVIGHQRSY